MLQAPAVPDLTLLFVGAAAVLLVLERLTPLRARKARFVARLGANVALAATAFALSALVVMPVVRRLLDLGANERIGLFAQLELSGWAEAGVGFLLLDLSFYYWHLANHRVPLLWRFHNVHHMDPDLDVTTGARFHFGEIALSTLFRAAQIVVTGVSLPTFAAYEAALQAATLFHHSNVRLPIGFERLLSWLIVTPRMHGIHHSELEREANSNYSVVLSLWDRLHGSVRLNVSQAEIVVGVPGYASAEDRRLSTLFLAPFRRQRRHWFRADGSRPERAESARGRGRLVE